MQEDVLQKKNDIVKIYLCFVDGKKIERKTQVVLKTLDNKCCYFSGDSILNLVKPGWFAKAKVIVYTKEGTYAGEGKISGIDFSLNKLLYTIERPKKWSFTQLRVGERKTTKLPIEIIFNEGLVINTEIINLSDTGFSVNAKENLTNLHIKFPCNCKIDMPEEKLEIMAKYVRQQLILDDYSLAGYKTYSFRFLNVLPTQKMVIKNYLRQIK